MGGPDQQPIHAHPLLSCRRRDPQASDARIDMTANPARSTMQATACTASGAPEKTMRHRTMRVIFGQHSGSELVRANGLSLSGQCIHYVHGPRGVGPPQEL